MPTNFNQIPPAIKTNCKSLKITTTYRGFTSIDQEIEREIALQWFSSKKCSFSQRNFLLKKDFL
ncbi:MAG: hypothetical protein ACR2KX_05675 [Chitinophagaceae bacterium]